MLFKPCGSISLLTDFSLRSPFVGLMHAVITQRYPEAKIIDLFHEVLPYAIAEAGFWLSRSYHYFPAGTVHVAVVDPGVGSERAIIAGLCKGQLFLAPNNGLLLPVFAGESMVECRQLDLAAVKQYCLPEISATFHGRDIFAPVAAALAAGQCDFEQLGPSMAVDDLMNTADSVIQPANWIDDCLTGAVVSIDHYGNLMTNIDVSMLGEQRNWHVICNKQCFTLTYTYASSAPGTAIALINSLNVVEIAIVNGNATQELDIKRGAKVIIQQGADCG